MLADWLYLCWNESCQCVLLGVVTCSFSNVLICYLFVLCLIVCYTVLYRICLVCMEIVHVRKRQSVSECFVSLID